MFHFFADAADIGMNTVHLRGENYNHLKNVLRVRPGERVMISDDSGRDYLCEVAEILSEGEPEVRLLILSEEESHELPADIYLFQGLPKSDKMELIIQKAVELGAHCIVPLETRNSVVRLDEKKKDSKVKRWNAISEAAAKQSKRSIVPEVCEVMRWKDAMQYVSGFEICMIPYENAQDIGKTMEMLQQLGAAGKTEERTAAGQRPRAAVFIGPEGGFTEDEIAEARQNGIVPVTLGRRILRTETAAICAMSMLMLTLEAGTEQENI